MPLLMAQAQETKFTTRQIIIAGDDNVQATSINNPGTIVGTLYAGITDAPSGIAINGKTVTTLPAPGGSFGVLYPRAINDNGDILGWARGSIEGNADVFLLQGGTYNTAYQATVIEPGGNANAFLPDPMGLTAKDQVFFNIIVSLSGPIGTQYGRPPHYRSVPSFGRFTVLQSIDSSGIVAGTAFSFNGVRTMFMGRGKNFATVLPPGSTNTAGGFLNNKGALAGSYRDSVGWHAFVYQGGNYTSFDMPEAAGTVAVTGINNKGRVVGTYTSVANGNIYGFLYNGSTVSSFGKYGGTDNVSVTLNDQGAMVVTRQIQSREPKYLSYRVSCSGTGC
jgi:probable HAF family extracellular repeat protein